MDVFDFIVVGAGAAGCVLAERLSADGRTTVLVLEAGGDDRRFWIKTPIGYGQSFFDPKVNWLYRSEPQPNLNGRSAHLPRGKVVGGSTSINAMVYCRGLATDFDDWRDAGNPGWGWSDVEPIFQAFERRVGKGEVRGEGPVWVSDREADYHPIKRCFFDAAEELGYARIPDLNSGVGEGVAPYEITTRSGFRWSSADAFLRPALRRSGVKLITDVLVDKIGITAGRAETVTYQRGKDKLQARANRAILLAAGAVGSPAILQRSGLGPAALLSSLGLEVQRHIPGVGARLQDHLGMSYFYRARQATLNADLGTWRGRLLAGARYLLTRDGPLSLSVNQIGGLVRTAAERDRPDAQLYFNPLSYSTEVAGKRELLKPDPWPGFITGFNSCRPTSLGRVEICATDPQTPPRIDPNYLDTAKDQQDAVACARLMGRLQKTEALQTLILAPLGFDPGLASDEALLDDVRARSGTVHHLCGTCAMKPEAEGGVVDPSLRVYGVEGLHVVDASIFPNITSANTQAPTLMVAYKAARLILESSR